MRAERAFKLKELGAAHLAVAVKHRALPHRVLQERCSRRNGEAETHQQRGLAESRVADDQVHGLLLNQAVPHVLRWCFGDGGFKHLVVHHAQGPQDVVGQHRRTRDCFYITHISSETHRDRHEHEEPRGGRAARVKEELRTARVQAHEMPEVGMGLEEIDYVSRDFPGVGEEGIAVGFQGVGQGMERPLRWRRNMPVFTLAENPVVTWTRSAMSRRQRSGAGRPERRGGRRRGGPARYERHC